ncbi:hypothetical protein GJ744_004658 [Endocarpon pusillum]|uniref:Uncharacterized protein n=1 Tax=Endocarpon pusillum TaxID=364733 RepID=A0A8H7ANL4_9EURO|nr:hypothetical protein GJ744_004658 [Endocarpon pusillum]
MIEQERKNTHRYNWLWQDESILGSKEKEQKIWVKVWVMALDLSTQCEAPVSQDLLRRVNGRQDGLATHEPFHLNALLGAARYGLLPLPPHSSREELSFSQIKAFSAKKSEELQGGTRGCGCFTLGEPVSRVRAPQRLSI